MQPGLERFLSAQQEAYPRALQEIRNGQKRSHWMWYIFPQLVGLGHSFDSQYYGIRDRQEALEYYQHPILGKRLREITYALLLQDQRDPQKIFGYLDSLKFHSCMTLFQQVSQDFLFQKVLEQFYGGAKDFRTLDMLKTEKQ